MHLKISSAKWRLIRLDLNELNTFFELCYFGGAGCDLLIHTIRGYFIGTAESLESYPAARVFKGSHESARFRYTWKIITVVS